MEKFYVNYDNGQGPPFLVLVREEESEPYHYLISDGESHTGGGRLLKSFCTKQQYEAKAREYIICSAIYINDQEKHEDQPTNIEIGFIVSGRRHNNCYATLFALYGKQQGENIIKYYKLSNENSGFITSLNRFVNRKEGMVIAKRENQLLVPSLHPEDGGELSSEDLFPMDYATMKY